jgi:hypothetical protein
LPAALCALRCAMPCCAASGTADRLRADVCVPCAQNQGLLTQNKQLGKQNGGYFKQLSLINLARPLYRE